MIWIVIFCSVLLGTGANVWHSEDDSRGTETCTPEMFGNDSNAYWACRAQLALQKNWYPSPIAGLFSYQVWNGFDGFWQNGVVLETMANFMYYGNNTRYKGVVQSSYRDLGSLLEAYYPAPSFDDMAWFGLSYARIYEVIGDPNFLRSAKDIYDWTWTNGWDHKNACGGGFWFDQNYDAKVTITNVEMLQLGAKLYRLTGSKDSDLLHKLNRTWNYILRTKIINPVTYLVSDEIFLDNCTHNFNYNYTYTHGVAIAALVQLNLTQIYKSEMLLGLAQKVADAAIRYFSVETDGVLMEPCNRSPEGCDKDALVFKGLFVRGLRYLMDVCDDKSRQQYHKWLQLNIDTVVKKNICDTPTRCNITYQDGPPFYNFTYPLFDEKWQGPYNISCPMTQASVFDLFVSNIAPGTTCTGKTCAYDPPTPPPRPLTCKNDPCPKGQDCCEYEGGYRTCCEPTQKCVKGYCE